MEVKVRVDVRVGYVADVGERLRHRQRRAAEAAEEHDL